MAMQHDRQDAIDARQRATAGSAPAGWHPILAATEVDVGTWVMRSGDGVRYGIVRALELGGQRGYRAVTWAERSEDRQLIGYFTSLRAATMAAHRRWLADHARPGGINGS